MFFFQLKEKTRAGNVFLVPVDHTESDNLHIQVNILHPDRSPVRANQNILISREISTILLFLLLFMTRALSLMTTKSHLNVPAPLHG